MESAFPNSGLKFLNHALNCLVRFGDVLSLHADPGDNSKAMAPFLRLTVINSSGSGLCQVYLDEPFFERFFLEPGEDSKAKILDAQMSAKTFQSCFRSKASSKQLLECELNVTDDDTQERVEITLKYDANLRIKHSLTYEAKRGLVPIAELGHNLIQLSPQTAKTWLDQFLSASTSTRFGEVTMWCYDEICLLKAKHEDLPSLKEDRKKGIQTSLKVSADDMDIWDVHGEELLTFPLKEFKAALILAETLSIPVDLRFSEGGKPLFIEMRTSEGARVMVVLATSTNDVTEAADHAAAVARPGEDARPNPNIARARARAAGQGDEDGRVGAGDGEAARARSRSAAPSDAAASQRSAAGNGSVRQTTPASRKGSAKPVLRTEFESQPPVKTSSRARNFEPPMQSTQLRNGGTQNGDAHAEADGEEPLFRGGSQATTVPMATGVPFDDDEDENDLEADQAGLDALEAYEKATQTQRQQQQSQLERGAQQASTAAPPDPQEIEDEREMRQQEEAELAAIANTLAAAAQNSSPVSSRTRPRPRPVLAANSSHPSRASGGTGSRFQASEAADVFEPLPMDQDNDLLDQPLNTEDEQLNTRATPVMDRAIVTVGTQGSSRIINGGPNTAAGSRRGSRTTDSGLFGGTGGREAAPPADVSLESEQSVTQQEASLLQTRPSRHSTEQTGAEEYSSDEAGGELDAAMDATQVEEYDAMF